MPVISKDWRERTLNLPNTPLVEGYVFNDVGNRLSQMQVSYSNMFR